MNRIILCAVLAAAFLAARHLKPTLPVVVPVTPVTPVTPDVPPPVAEIAAVASKMKPSDRADMGAAYAMFSSALAADPMDDPVFPDTASLRRAHRAMLLVLWRGLLGNNPGQVPGLKEAVEGAFAQRIGSADVLLNPDAKQSAAKALADIAASFNARP
jgi:hypothetical protein